HGGALGARNLNLYRRRALLRLKRCLSVDLRRADEEEGYRRAIDQHRGVAQRPWQRRGVGAHDRVREVTPIDRYQRTGRNRWRPAGAVDNSTLGGNRQRLADAKRKSACVYVGGVQDGYTGIADTRNQRRRYKGRKFGCARESRA